jgi:hypothetical protein
VSRRVRHPLFARIFDRMAAKTEKQGAAEHRDRLLSGLSGRVIEVGAGNGLNFSHYPGAVSEVLAVEPEDYLRARAERVAEAASARSGWSTASRMISRPRTRASTRP